MNQHTPGPWNFVEVEYTASQPAVFEVRDDEGAFIASAADEADALLIAAAPELLEACESVIRTTGRVHAGACIVDEVGKGCICHVDKLRAAIAKARGQL